MRTRLMTRRLVIVVMVAGIGLGGCSSASFVRDRLVNTTDDVQLCVSPSADRPWAALRSTEIEFGADYYTVSPLSHFVTVRDVRLVGVHGTLTLEHVAFAPGGAIGEGFAWHSKRFIEFPRAWEQRIGLGGRLVVSAGGARAGFPRGYDGDSWQLVVGLRAGSDSASAERIDVTYLEGGTTVTVHGKTSVGIFRSAHSCP